MAIGDAESSAHVRTAESLDLVTTSATDGDANGNAPLPEDLPSDLDESDGYLSNDVDEKCAEMVPIKKSRPTKLARRAGKPM